MSFLRFPRVLGRFGLGFRWCLSFSHPLPTKPIFVFVQARLCDGCSPTSAVISLSLEGPKGELAGFLTTQLVLGHVFPAACRFAMLEAIFSFSFLWVLRQRFGLFCACGFVAFLVVLGSDLGGVWPFRIHCRRDPVLSLSRLGCGTVFVHRLQPLTWFYKISKVLFRQLAAGLRTDRFWFLGILGSDFGGVWPFRIHCRPASFRAGRWLFDDPTCFGTCLSIWPLVRAFYPATRLRRLNLLATFGACVGEAACDNTTLDSKLLATMPGRLHVSRLHRAVDCYMAIGTFIFQSFL